jgi:uroporphyrinogen-III synthase
MHAPWPASTLIGAVGAATAEAVRRWVAGAESARIIAPAPGGGETDEAESGSEALWALLLATGIRPRRVLVLRAQGGRDWLLQRWRDAGVEVNALAVYSRIPHRRTARERDWLQAHGGAAAIATVITSSAAVEALARQLDDLPAVLDAVRAGPALASHPRIAQRLHAAGFASVRVIALEPASIAAALAGAPPAST